MATPTCAKRRRRAAFELYDAKHGTIGGKKGLRIDPVSGKTEEGHSAYRSRIKSQFSKHQRELLDRKTVAGHLIRFEVPAQEWRDPEALIEFEETGYESTPPFARPPTRRVLSIIQMLCH